ncbi:hypothetical protein [Actinomadura macrotermitis]|uniref:Uncharacterized protein n=1 Tax=Actinomadura macrotermitis TaxID=2585200 RepID=A0A7K0C7S3_9ACTN|nr:hypothetical protein [Actinomadura macrotermitis]MQY09485.1 hypothetical protein [Actinomadura macrotermitis]
MTQTTIQGGVGVSVSGGSVEGDLHITQQTVIKQFLRRVLDDISLDPEAVARVRHVCVPTVTLVAARAALRDHGAVALLGEAGAGRTTAAITLLAELEVTPRPVLLDEDAGPTDIERGHGYILDLQASWERSSPRTGLWVHNLVARAKETGCPLIVRSREPDWRALGLDSHVVPALPAEAAPGLDVLRSHLKELTGQETADDWAHRVPVRQRMAQARPPDAVRLAKIIDNVLRLGTSGPDPTADALAAYANWSDDLAARFRDTNGTSDPVNGQRRALLIAIAVLDGAPASTIFGAAADLTKRVELQPPPGGALVGPGIRELATEAHAELQEGCIRFTRPSYAESVLDYVWSERSHLLPVLRKWMEDLPSPADEATARATDSLTGLALRHGDAGLVASAAYAWAQKDQKTRPHAVTALTAAALSERTGREIRQRMYDWSRSASAPEAVHLTVAEVCAGPLAQTFPQIALTRLRHLAVRSNERVKEASIQSLLSLAQDRRLRRPVLREITDWAEGEEPRRSTGLRAFLRLARLRAEERVLLLPERPGAETALLGRLWRTVLRERELQDVTGRVAAGWLEAAFLGRAPAGQVVDVFARTCQTSIDLANLTETVLEWMRTAPAEGDRKPLAVELLAQGRDRVQARMNIDQESR